MYRKNILSKILKIGKLPKSQPQTAGFTLLELLAVVSVGSILITGLLFFVVQLLQVDKKEFAQTETQREMAQAMNYIAGDLKEAVYVYDGECLTTGNDTCPGLVNAFSGLQNTADVKPVLAFWKLEEVPYGTPTSASENLPDTCSTSECNNLKLYRNTYTLVVYFLRKDTPAGSNWQGPARITRYKLRKYNAEQLSTLALQDPNYVAPGSPTADEKDVVSFASWPCPSKTPTCAPTKLTFNANYEDVLVDLVDHNPLPTFANGQPCPADYKATPPDILTPGSNSSFYACVRPWAQGLAQDVIVSLRGNGLKRADVKEGATRDPNNLPVTYLPSVQTQVQARGAFQRKPGELK